MIIKRVVWILFFMCISVASKTFKSNSTSPHIIANHHHQHQHHATNISHHKEMMQSTMFAGRRVFGNVIITDLKLAHVMGKQILHMNMTQVGSPHQNAINRLKHAKKTMSQLPFPVNYWKSTLGTLCPHHRTDVLPNARGVMISHYQVWHDFVHQEQNNVTNISDDDVIIVFEDDAHLTVANIDHILQHELETMRNHDFKYLGWCLERNVALCYHAYILTRAGAKKLVPLLDWCGKSIELQVWDLSVSTKNFTLTLASSLFEDYIIIPDYSHSRTQGIFIQKKGFVSFNDHGLTVN